MAAGWPQVGRTLGPPGNLLQMNVKQALAQDVKTEIAISDRVYLTGGKQFGTAWDRWAAAAAGESRTGGTQS
jgi:hypothetical protein